jgi:hypothetical protein
MSSDRLEVSITFDPARGYVATAAELRQPIVALSLGGLRRRIEIAMLPNDVCVVLQLDGLAERERHRRRAKMGVTAPIRRSRSRGLSILTQLLVQPDGHCT